MVYLGKLKPPKEGGLESLYQIFPDGQVPVCSPVPAVDLESAPPVYIVDRQSLNDQQVQGLVKLLLERWQDGITQQEAESSVENGFGLSTEYFLGITSLGGSEFSAVDDPALWQQFAIEFQQLSDLPSITLQISQLDLYSLLSMLQLAFRMPGNDGAMRQVAERLARQFQSALCQPGTALWEVAERGWHQEFDVVYQPDKPVPE